MTTAKKSMDAQKKDAQKMPSRKSQMDADSKSQMDADMKSSTSRSSGKTQQKSGSTKK